MKEITPEEVFDAVAAFLKERTLKRTPSPLVGEGAAEGAAIRL